MKTLALILLAAIAIGALVYNFKSSEPKQQVVILLGPPGSGKGTQATRIAKELGIIHISTGDLLRENIRQNTPLGKRAQQFMSSGKLVPDELVLEMLSMRISQPDTHKGYLLDGVPRTLSQAQALEKIISPQANVMVIALDVSDDTIMKRIAGRAQQSQAGAVRPDDKPEIVRERLKVYHQQTEPLLQFYSDKGTLNAIDGEKSPEDVFKAVQKVINAQPQ
jgi:adenylate kinase